MDLPPLFFVEVNLNQRADGAQIWIGADIRGLP